MPSQPPLIINGKALRGYFATLAGKYVNDQISLQEQIELLILTMVRNRTIVFTQAHAHIVAATVETFELKSYATQATMVVAKHLSDLSTQ